MFSNSKNLKSNSSHVIRRQLMMYGASTACIALTACGPLLSSNKSEIGQSPTTAVDETYMLPKPQVRVQLRKAGDAFSVNVGEPTVVGDASHRYNLVHNRSFFASDALDIGVDEKTGLLTTLNTSTDLQVDETLVAAASAAGVAKAFFEAAVPAGEEQIVVDRLIDPTKPAEVREVVDLMNQVYGAAMHIDCSPRNMAGPTPVSLLGPAAKCIQLSVNIDGFGPEYTPAPSEASCDTGICYRSLLTYNIAASIPNNAKGATGLPNANNVKVTLPDTYTVYKLDTTRPAFVTRTTNLTMVNGIIKSVHTDQPSGSVAVLGTPIRIIEAFFGAIGAAFKAQTDTVNQQIALGKANAELRKQEEERKSAREAATASQVAMILKVDNGVTAPQSNRDVLPKDVPPGKPGGGKAGDDNMAPKAGERGLPDDPHKVVPNP